MELRRPNRISHTFEQTIEGTAGEIFPLYCPVRELDWAPGWNPSLVISQSGVAEEDCVFVTETEGAESIWVVTEHDPVTFRLQMWKLTPGITTCRLDIRLLPIAAGRTRATITYTHTSLGPKGDEFVRAFTREHYESFMGHWETAMNHYLRTGRMLDG